MSGYAASEAESFAQVIGSCSDLPSGSTVILEYGEQLPSIDKKKVAVGKKVSKDDCCVC